MADFVTDVTLTAENALQFTFNTPNRVVTMAAGTDIIVRDKLEFIQVHNDIFQTADVDVDTILTVNGVAFTGTHADLLSNIEAMAAASNGGTGTSSDAAIETWSYRNSDYVSATNRLTLSHNNFSIVNISDNLTLLSKTAPTLSHDGTKFLFTEGDVVLVKVTLKIDSNVSDNLLILRLKSRTGNFTISQVSIDTNVQQFGQVLNCEFAPIEITADLATDGFDINILDYVSTADSFVYNMKFTLINLGQNV